MTGRAEAVSVARALSKLGWCSRAQAAVLVSAGRVTVDGVVVRDASFRVDMRRAKLAVDGEPVHAVQRTYLMMHKPPGFVSTTSDELGRRTVFDLLPAGSPHVNAVGRLDLDSEGLLLFSSDTRWADRITDPATHTDKFYDVQLVRPATDAERERMLAGVQAGRGETLAFRSVTACERGHDWITVIIDEGRNRQVRRVLEAVGHEVVRLIRTAIGPVRLGDLPHGAVRPLTADEKRSLESPIA